MIVRQGPKEQPSRRVSGLMLDAVGGDGELGAETDARRMKALGVYVHVYVHVYVCMY